VIAVILIALAVAAAMLAAASLRLASLVSTLLAAYLALTGGMVFVVLVLSPFRWATRGGLAAAEAVLLAAAVVAWWLRGRPRLPLDAARDTLRQVRADPFSVGFVAVAALVLAYELVLVLTDPPNNTDSLVYHLPRAAAWAQHHGVYWIPNAPVDRMNEFQPVAEQQILFLFVATGKAALFALPQYLAGLAILLAVFGTARRLGFSARAAVCAACLLATFSLPTLEATTAQNDLVAAAFPAAAAFWLRGSSRVELACAGAAAAIGLGVKLTTLLVWPVLAVLLLRRGRRALLPAAAGGVAGFALVGVWGFVLNAVHTGHLLGHGSDRAEWQASPAWPESLRTALHVLYRTFDLSVLSYRLVYVLAGLGIAAALAAAVYGYRHGGSRRALVAAGAAGLPLLAPLLTIGGANAVSYLGAHAGLPVHEAGIPNTGWASGLNRGAIEDSSAFGPVGAIFLLAAAPVVAVAYVLGRADLRRLALALSLPVFLILLGLQSRWNPWQTRFLLVPAALTAPLFAGWFRSRLATAATVVAAALVVTLTLVHNARKPFSAAVGHPWQLSWRAALTNEEGSGLDAVLADYERLVPRRACVGAVADPRDPSFLLFGLALTHRVYYLPVTNALFDAYRNHLSYVVVSTGPDRWAAGAFTKAGWKRRMVATTWLLLVSPTSGSRTGDCLA
jgi:hypothetical protein